jgi:hypothetical protein
MQVMAIFVGRFHPFHHGHYSSFKQLVDKFGIENTLLAISGKQKPPRSPFSFIDRAKMAMALGVPKENIIRVKQPYSSQDYANYLRKKKVDPNNIVLVFGVSKKDMEGDPKLGIPPDPRFTFEPTKDGKPSYLQPYSDDSKLENMFKHAYVISTDVKEFPIAGKDTVDGSDIRSMYINGNDQLKNQILIDLYGKAADYIKPIFTHRLRKDFNESLELKIALVEFMNNSIQLIDSANQEQKNKIIMLLKEAHSKINPDRPDYLQEK